MCSHKHATDTYTHLQLVVKAQLHVGHAGQEDLHDDLAVDIAAQDGAIAGRQHIDLLHYVQEHLVLLVLYVVRPPPHRPRHLYVRIP